MARVTTLNYSLIPSNCSSLIKTLVKQYPTFAFHTGERFSFRLSLVKKGPSGLISLGPPQPYFDLQTLHELAHALCGHQTYETGIARLKIECEAWARAKELYLSYSDLCPNDWSGDFVQSSLDTYRNWLHSQATCPSCGLTRFQTQDGVYHCPYCDSFNP